MNLRLKRAAFCLAVFGLGLLAGRGFRGKSPPALADCVPSPTSADLNGDGSVDVSDAVCLLRFLFLGGDVPLRCDSASAPVSTVIIVRHAEKDGPSDAPLSPEGELRALRLAEMLATAPIDHLIASDLIRTQQTLEPTSLAHGGLPVEQIDDDAPEEVVRRVLSFPAGTFTVVSHHSYTIHDILEGLGLEGVRSIPVSGDVYDNFFVVLLPAGGCSQLLHLHY
ncbi:MAG: histidine phosphatase family protein [Planctomycetes bacterium]|nr:histidine phosphatase family protein [Planctomycetota bacterium]